MPWAEELFKDFNPLSTKLDTIDKNSTVETGFLTESEFIQIINSCLNDDVTEPNTEILYRRERFRIDVHGTEIKVNTPVVKVSNLTTHEEYQELIRDIRKYCSYGCKLNYRFESDPSGSKIHVALIRMHYTETHLKNKDKEYLINVNEEDYVFDHTRKETKSGETPESQIASRCLTRTASHSLNNEQEKHTQVENESIKAKQITNDISEVVQLDITGKDDKTENKKASQMEFAQNPIETTPIKKFCQSDLNEDFDERDGMLKGESTIFIHGAGPTDLTNTPSLHEGLLSTTDYVENSENQGNTDYSEYFVKNDKSESVVENTRNDNYVTINLEPAKPQAIEPEKQSNIIGKFNGLISSVKRGLIMQSLSLIICLTLLGIFILTIALMNNWWMVNQIDYVKGNVAGRSSTYIGLFGITRTDVCILPDGATIILSRDYIDFKEIINNKPSDSDERQTMETDTEVHPEEQPTPKDEEEGRGNLGSHYGEQIIITDNSPIYKEETEFIKRAQVFRDHRAIGNLDDGPYEARSQLFGSSFYDLEISRVKSLMYGGRLAFLLFAVVILVLSLVMPMILIQYYPQYYSRLNLSKDTRVLLGYISKTQWLCALGIHLAGLLTIMIYTRLPTCIDEIGRSVPPSFSIDYWFAVSSLIPLVIAYFVYNLKRHDKSPSNILDEFYDDRGKTNNTVRAEEV